ERQEFWLWRTRHRGRILFAFIFARFETEVAIHAGRQIDPACGYPQEGQRYDQLWAGRETAGLDVRRDPDFSRLRRQVEGGVGGRRVQEARRAQDRSTGRCRRRGSRSFLARTRRGGRAQPGVRQWRE